LFQWAYLKLHLGKYAGTPCIIPYGQGSIYGFFSQDNVQVGDVIIKDQVSVLTSLVFSQIMLLWFADDLLLPILQEFAEITREGSLVLSALPFDGILGLGFQDASIGKVTPVWYTQELY